MSVLALKPPLEKPYRRQLHRLGAAPTFSPQCRLAAHHTRPRGFAPPDVTLRRHLVHLHFSYIQNDPATSMFSSLGSQTTGTANVRHDWNW